MVDERTPLGLAERTGNSTRLCGVRRRLLLFSNSTSATPLPVRSLPPWVMGRLAKAPSKPLPVCRSSCTSPFTWLRRTMRTPGLAAETDCVVVVATAESGGLAGEVASEASCARSGVPQRTIATKAAVEKREFVMMMLRLSWQGVARRLRGRGNLPCEGETSIVLRPCRWRGKNCFQLVISFAAAGSRRNFFDQAQRCFHGLAA